MGMTSDREPDARLDCCGLYCPQPVIRTRKALLSGDSVLTIVDNETAQHNVTRMAAKQGFAVSAETRADGIYLAIARSAAVRPATPGRVAAVMVKVGDKVAVGDPLISVA